MDEFIYAYADKGIPYFPKEGIPELKEHVYKVLYKYYPKHLYNFHVGMKLIREHTGFEIDIHTCDKDGNFHPLKHYVATFNLTEFPGCCGILVSHNMRIKMKWRGQDFWKISHEIKVNLAKLLYYTTLMATTLTNNLIENHKLMSNGWTFIDRSIFINKRTNNEIITWIKILN